MAAGSQVVQMVSDHLNNGNNVNLILHNGRRYVKLVHFYFFGPTYEINGATEATIQRLMAEKFYQKARAQPRAV